MKEVDLKTRFVPKYWPGVSVYMSQGRNERVPVDAGATLRWKLAYGFELGFNSTFNQVDLDYERWYER